MNHRLKSYAVAACALVAVLALCFAAMAWNEPGSPPPAGNVAAPINTGATAQTKAGDLNLGGKLSVAGDFASGRFCLAGKCCATWEECFSVPAPPQTPPPTCSCTSWIYRGCSTGWDGCNIFQLRQTRTCDPAGCDSESRCVADAGCGGGYEEGGCEPYAGGDFCEYAVWECGSWTDCDGTVYDCGSCAVGYCSYFNHRCCLSCADMGYECGYFDNGCGGENCGECAPPAGGPFHGEKCEDHVCVPNMD